VPQPPADLTIRNFAWGDVPAIAEIYGHYVDHSVVTFDTERPSEAYTAEKYGHMVELGHPVLIAESAGTTVGFAYASVYRARPAYRFTCEDTIYLAPAATGRGIGSALLDRLITDARTFGFKQMIAVIADGTEGSIGLHQKHGFAVLGRFPDLGFKFDRWLGIVHMQRAL
jgi:L-amino acid N-acyltransferase YncA